MFYTAGQNLGKLNGIKWHYFKGPSYSLHSTTMMIRPLEFWRHSVRSNYKNNKEIWGSYQMWNCLNISEAKQYFLPSSNKRLLCELAKVLDWIWSLLHSQRSLLRVTMLIRLDHRGCHSLSRFQKGRNCSVCCASNYYWILLWNYGSQMINMVYFM